MFVIRPLSQWQEDKSPNNEKLNCARGGDSLLGKRENKVKKTKIRPVTSTIISVVAQVSVAHTIKQSSCTQIKRTHT